MLREVEGLRSLGARVETCSIRRPGEDHLIGPEERAEAAATFYVLDAARSPGFALRAAGTALARPGRLASAVALAWRTARPGLAGAARQAAYLAEAVLLARHLADRGAGHLHNHFADPSASVAMLAAHLAGIPYSYTLHGPAELYEPRSWHLAEKTARAAFVACISHFARAQAMLFSDPAHWGRLRIVHCGVEPGRYGAAGAGPRDGAAPDGHGSDRGPGDPAGGAQARPDADGSPDGAGHDADARGAPDGALRLLFVGRLTAIKGVRVLLEAFAAAREGRPGLTLTLVGDGDDRAHLEALAAPLGPAVAFLGYRSQAGVAEALARADALVLPSFAEGLPVVLMEALAARRPVIATRVAGVGELVEDGVSGLLVHAGDAEGLAAAIGRLADDPALGPRLGRAGRAVVEAEFDARVEAARLARLFAGDLGTDPRPAPLMASAGSAAPGGREGPDPGPSARSPADRPAGRSSRPARPRRRPRRPFRRPSRRGRSPRPARPRPRGRARLMCGIAGYLWRPGAGPDPERTVEAMMAAIAHRGPDGRGHWVDAEAGVALGHLRLAIVELSEAGHQPMVSACGRHVLTYNGEIYNHAALRARIDATGRGPDWRGGSDTETLLAGIALWGLEATLGHAVGMFALGLWDREARTLALARDRFGEKPLYFGWQGAGEGAAMLFGSELKALRAHPRFEGALDRSALLEVLRHGNVGEDRAIYAGLGKVRAGEVVRIDPATRETARATYWDAAALSAAPKPPRRPDGEVLDALETLLGDAVEGQTMADVPLGAFLSGGVDSSAVVALMQARASRPVHTFSIGFAEARYDEAEYARAVAAHLGTRHTDLHVSDADLLDVVPQLPRIYDEPFADSSQIPTYLVARLAREHVTVALSGDGGDELFGGYDRYGHGARLDARLRGVPAGLRRLGAGALRAVPAGALSAALSRLVPTPQGKEPVGQRLHRLAGFAGQPGLEALHRAMVSVWRYPEAAVPGAAPPPSRLADGLPPRGELGAVERMMQLDMLTYMTDDILAKVDRATMAVALESRAPLLDHRVAEFAWGLPPDQKLRGAESKWALRHVLYRHVPRALIERPKMGFEVPIGLWLRGGLRDWAGDLLDPARLAREGNFDPATIAAMWREHLSGRFNWGAQLWCVLMVQAWLEEARG